MDPQLSQALKAAPTNEYLLQGSILDASLDVLLCRLKGLCDHADSPDEKFVDHEMVYAISKYTWQSMEDISHPIFVRLTGENYGKFSRQIEILLIAWFLYEPVLKMIIKHIIL